MESYNYLFFIRGFYMADVSMNSRIDPLSGERLESDSGYNYARPNVDLAFRLLGKIRTGHKFYADGNTSETERGKLLEVFENKVFPDLEYHCGLDLAFCTLYLLYGNEFLEFEFGVKSLEEYLEKVFRVK